MKGRGAGSTAEYIMFLAFLSLLAGPMLMLFLPYVPALGHQIPQDDIIRDYILGFVWALVLWIGILVWPVSRGDKRSLLRIWLIKIVVVLGAMLFYESHYGLDAYDYFAAPQNPVFVWQGLEFGNGTENMMKLSWLHQHLIPDSYHAMKVSFAMVGLIAIYFFYRAAVRFLGREEVRVLYLLALFPSILFWSSILGKDPVTLLGIGLYAYGVVGLYTHSGIGPNKLTYAAAIAAGIILASFFRLWLGPILLAPLTVFVVFRVRNIVARTVVLLVVAVAFTQSLTVTLKRFNIEVAQDLVERTDELSRSWAFGGSGQEVPGLRSAKEMARFAPIGAFTALFRPLPGERMNLFGVMAGLENAVLLMLAFRLIKHARWRDFKQPLVLWAIALILIWSIVYGFVSTQNLGTAVRFKLQVLPVLLGLLCHLGRRDTSPEVMYGYFGPVGTTNDMLPVSPSAVNRSAP